MKYLVFKGDEDSKFYAGIKFITGKMEGVAFDTSIMVHLENDFVCEVSSEVSEDLLLKFESSEIIDVRDYQDSNKVEVVHLLSDDFDEDFGTEPEDDEILDGSED